MALFELEWLGGTSAAHFRRVRPGIGDLPWGTLDPHAFPEPLVERARASWTTGAYQEYCTAAAFARVTEALLQARAPVDLVGMAGGFVADEMSHVELNARVAGELGGGAPMEVDFTRLAPEPDPDLTPLQRANELIVRICCVGETFSLPVLSGTMAVASHPLIQAVLKRIVREEAPHGRLGWLYLDWVHERLDPDEKARLAGVALDALSAFAPYWKGVRTSASGDRTAAGWSLADVHALGWMERGDYARAARRAARDRVLRPLARYGIPVDPESAVA